MAQGILLLWSCRWRISSYHISLPLVYTFTSAVYQSRIHLDSVGPRAATSSHKLPRSALWLLVFPRPKTEFQP
ncbi:hypothetical protein GN956_G26814 [Arapaima gigas]